VFVCVYLCLCVCKGVDPSFVCGFTQGRAHCNALQRIATHSNALQRTATYCNTLQHTARCISENLARVFGSRISLVFSVSHTFTHTLHSYTPFTHTLSRSRSPALSLSRSLSLLSLPPPPPSPPYSSFSLPDTHTYCLSRTYTHTHTLSQPHALSPHREPDSEEKIIIIREWE